MAKLLQCTVVALALGFGPASAEELAAGKQAAAKRVTSPEPGATSGLLPSAIAITATAGSSEATISASRSWENAGDDLGLYSLSLKLSASLDKDSEEAIFVSGGNRVSGTSAELTFTRDFIRTQSLDAPNSARSITLYKKASALCRQKTAASATSLPEDQLAQRCGPASFEGSADFKNLPKFSDIRTYLTKDEQREVADEAFYEAPLYRLGVTGGIGYTEFEYRDPRSLGERSTERTPFSISAHGGQLTSKMDAEGALKGLLYIGAGGEYKEDYKDDAARTLCQAPPATGPQECFSGAFGKPDRTKTAELFSVVRWQPARNNAALGFKGIETRAAYDLEHDIYSVGASIYLIADDDGLARGGVRLSWRSTDNDPATKDDNFNFGVFVGIPLSAF